MWSAGPAAVLLGMILWGSDGNTQLLAEEVELFNSDQQSRLGWQHEPSGSWDEIRMPPGSGVAGPMLQACAKRQQRSVFSRWMERRDANHLYMDISVAQEEERPGELVPLKVHLLDRDTPVNRFPNGPAVLELQNSKLFSQSDSLMSIGNHLNRSLSLGLGPVTRRGFHLAFSYTGSCVFIASIRVYYKTCPEFVSNLTSFMKTAADSGTVQGHCVAGAVESSTPERECGIDGAWGPQEGACSCDRGREEMDDTCKACRIGYYKPTSGRGKCELCPSNTRTTKEGSENCECLQGYSRLPSDPHDLGCSKPPSAPVNLTVSPFNDSALVLTWDPPHDLGGRKDVTYAVNCEKKPEMQSRWEPCGGGVVFQPDSNWLSGTSVILLGLNPQLDYRLLVEARNQISAVQETSHSATATVAMHRWRNPPAPITTVTTVTTVTTAPAFNHTAGETIKPAPHQSPYHRSVWLTGIICLSAALLIAVIFVAACLLQRNYTKHRSEPDLEMLHFPAHPEISYQPHIPEPAPQNPNSTGEVFQLLEEFGSRLLDTLKDVLVERNQLTLGKELGKGEFGSVYEGILTTQAGVDLKVAVKTVRVGIHSRQDLQEFLQEAEIMRNFDHENVVKLLGVTLKKEEESPLPLPLVIIPYMKHGDLRRFLIATRYGDIPMFVPYQTLLRFMSDIAAGMAYLSSKGFLHRDLAARNCMLGDDLRVRVADFGLSKQTYSSNYYRQKAAIRVPIKWMAIESLSESVYTSKSDVWSFGVTMWEIVSRGRTPYPAVHNYELLDLLLSGLRLKAPADCDPKLYGLMKSCWDPEPGLRPDFRDLHEALGVLLSELPVLEAWQEARYINQGLDAAAGSAYENPQTDSGGRQENVYLSSPVGGGTPQLQTELVSKT